MAPTASEDSGRVTSRIEVLETALGALQGLVSDGLSARRALEADAHETRDLHATLERRVEELIFAVSEGISKVERAEARIRATVRRARAELEDNGTYSPALDAEAAELRVIDGGGGEESRVPDVPAAVAPLDLTDIPGDWSAEDMDLLRGA